MEKLKAIFTIIALVVVLVIFVRYYYLDDITLFQFIHDLLMSLIPPFEVMLLSLGIIGGIILIIIVLWNRKS